MIIEIFSINIRLNNMTRVMKKMILNVNTFIQKIVNRIKYFTLPQFVFVQIMKRFKNETSIFVAVAVCQNQIVSSMQFVQQFNFFYQNNQFMNSEFYQRYFENDFSKSANDKCLYCFKNDHIFKKNCFVFQKNITTQQIHIVDRRIYLKSQRSKSYQMRMWMKRNQRECVKFFENFQYSVNSFALNFAVNLKSVFIFSFVFVVAEKVNIININIDFVKKLFFDEKNDSKIVILNHMSNIEIVTLFVVVVQISKKNESKKNKKIMKKILNKQIEKKNHVTFKIDTNWKMKIDFNKKCFEKTRT